MIHGIQVVHVADPDDRVFTFDSRLAIKINESLENPAPTEEDVNEIDECEEIVEQGDEPLDLHVLHEYEQSLLDVISDGNLIDYSTVLEYCVKRNCAENSARPHNAPDAVIESSPFVAVTRSNGGDVALKKKNCCMDV